MKIKNILFIFLISLSTLGGCFKKKDIDSILYNIMANEFEAYNRFDDALKVETYRKDKDYFINSILGYDEKNKVSYNYIEDDDETYEYYSFMEGINFIESYPKSKTYKFIDIDHSSYLYWTKIDVEVEETITYVKVLQAALFVLIEKCLDESIGDAYSKNVEITYNFLCLNSTSISGMIVIDDYNKEVFKFEIKDCILKDYEHKKYDNRGELDSEEIVKLSKKRFNKPSYKKYEKEEYDKPVGSLIPSSQNEIIYGLVLEDYGVPSRYEIHRNVQGRDNVYKFHYDPFYNTLYIYVNTIYTKYEFYFVYDNENDVMIKYDVTSKTYTIQEKYGDDFVDYEQLILHACEIYEDNKMIIENKLKSNLSSSKAYVNKPGDFSIVCNDGIDLMIKYNDGLPTYLFSEDNISKISIRIENNTTLILPSFEDYSLS